MKINRDYFKTPTLLILIGLVLILGCVRETKNEMSKPNILILMSDNHSWDHLGCYGDPVIQTPTIDKLSAQGIRFNHAYCSAPSCTPARGRRRRRWAWRGPSPGGSRSPSRGAAPSRRG